MNSLLTQPLKAKQDVEEKKKLTAKLIAADKAKAQALLLQAVKKLEANAASSSPIAKRILV
jgi:hypothetical protein